MTPLRLSGLIAAPHTPISPDGNVNLSAVRQQAELLVEGHVSAAFVCGTTGEGLSLSTAERMQLAKQWVSDAPPSLPVIVHVGHVSLPEAQSLAEHAQSIGARAISTLAPFFFKPQTVAALVEFCVQIAAAAPSLPFYFYHLPSMTGVTLSMVEFMHQARGRIPTFAGIKYTHDNLMEFQQCVRLAGNSLDVLFGRDEMLLAGLAMGAKGAIGSTYNYAAPVYHRLIAAVGCGDLAAARDCQSQAVQLVEILRRDGEIPAAKAIMEMIGVECGPPRPPLPSLTAEQRALLRQDLTGLDIFTRPLGPIGD